MAIMVQLPQDIENQLRSEWKDLERHALEGLVTEAFRCGKLSSHEVAEILGLGNRWEAVRFLEERGAYPGVDVEDLAADRATLARVMKSAAA
jgi:hypothetical protein